MGVGSGPRFGIDRLFGYSQIMSIGLATNREHFTLRSEEARHFPVPLGNLLAVAGQDLRQVNSSARRILLDLFPTAKPVRDQQIVSVSAAHRR